MQESRVVAQAGKGKRRLTNWRGYRDTEEGDEGYWGKGGGCRYEGELN